MSRLRSVLLSVILILALFPLVAPAARAAQGGGDVYLALGDSLAVGYQPGRGITQNGYVDELLRRVAQEQIPGLRLRNVGCAGETSLSMITGNGSPCSYAAGSQLDAAVAYVQAHPGEVAFITIGVGANDLVGRCLDPRTGRIEPACAADLRPRLRSRVARVVDALATAAGAGVPIVGMTYYDPFLGFWGLVAGGRTLARVSLRSFEAMNTGLANGYEEAGATVADVASTFRIDDFDETVVVSGRGRIPVNVALTCRWTWFCSNRFAFDVHPNRTGYRKIARTFHRALADLLPSV